MSLKRSKSRVARNPILIASGVDVKIDGNKINVAGSNGDLSTEFPNSISVQIEDKTVIVCENKASALPMAGTFASNISNMIIGVSKGYIKNLILNGVGYKAVVSGSILKMELGYSNPVEYEIPEDVVIKCKTNTELEISGCNKERVGLVASQITRLRKYEPYGGKGVKYANVHYETKEGKKK